MLLRPGFQEESLLRNSHEVISSSLPSRKKSSDFFRKVFGSVCMTKIWLFFGCEKTRFD